MEGFLEFEVAVKKNWLSYKGAPASKKKKTGVDFFAKDNSVGLTNLPNQAHVYIW